MEFPTTVDLLQVSLIIAVVVLGGLVHGVLGLGFPLVTTPLLSLLFDVRTAIVITLLPTIVINLFSILRGGRWRESIGRFWPLALYAMLGSIIGTQLLLTFNPEPFRLLLAGVILFYLNMNRFGSLKLGWIHEHRQLAMLLFGTAGGVLAGTVNVMVPLLIIYALEAGITATVMVQVFNLCFISGKLTQLGLFTGVGLVSGGVFQFATFLACCAALALWGGMMLRDKVSSESYYRWLRNGLWAIVPLLIAQVILSASGF